jgi:hypothetical protein
MDLHTLILTTEQRDLIADALQRAVLTMQPLSTDERIKLVQTHLLCRTIENLPVDRVSVMLTPTVR